MFPIGELNNSLRLELAPKELFDFYRLVDVVTHEVLEYSAASNEIVHTHSTCHHVWGSDGPCANCASRTCVLRQEPIVKIMSLDGQYLLIYSIPVHVGNKPYALELIKDITHSLVVPSVENEDNLEIVDMIRQFNNVASRDSFTHLYNKTFTLNTIQNELDECRNQNKQPEFNLIMFDIDLFKVINDKYGHIIGDDILSLFAKELNVLAIKFEGGWAARYGGDEFVLFAPKGIGADGQAIIEDALASFEADVKKNIPSVSKVTASYGVASALLEDSSRDLVDRADQAMYEMKEEHHKALAD